MDDQGSGRRLEDLARDEEQRARAIAGTSALMLAAVQAGRQATELAPALGLQRSAAQLRLQKVRARYLGITPALEVDEPLHRERPQALLRTPAAEREWLAISEAAVFAGCNRGTIRNWWRGGLLPNSRDVSSRLRLYPRADLARIVTGPSNGRGADYGRLRAGFDA